MFGRTLRCKPSGIANYVGAHAAVSAVLGMSIPFEARVAVPQNSMDKPCEENSEDRSAA